MKQRVRFNTLFVCILFCLILFSNLILTSAGTLMVTEEHPFLINGSWIGASDLKVGNLLNTIEGKNVKIKSIMDIISSDNFLVYNLEAKEYSDFVVNGGEGLGVIVHNSGSSDVGNSQLFYSKSGYKLGTPEYN
jgi:intein/homing endonuclease